MEEIVTNTETTETKKKWENFDIVHKYGTSNWKQLF
jgi:hypothetical protein